MSSWIEFGHESKCTEKRRLHHYYRHTHSMVERALTKDSPDATLSLLHVLTIGLSVYVFYTFSENITRTAFIETFIWLLDIVDGVSRWWSVVLPIRIQDQHSQLLRGPNMCQLNVASKCRERHQVLRVVERVITHENNNKECKFRYEKG